MKLLLHLAEQFVKRVSIAVPAKSDLPRVFYPLTQSIKRQKGDFLSMFFIFSLPTAMSHLKQIETICFFKAFSGMAIRNKEEGRYLYSVSKI